MTAQRPKTIGRLSVRQVINFIRTAWAFVIALGLMHFIIPILVGNTPSKVLSKHTGAIIRQIEGYVFLICLIVTAMLTLMLLLALALPPNPPGESDDHS